MFLGFAAMACAETVSNVQTAGTEVGGEDDPVAPKVITAAPSTFEVALGEEVPQRLELHLGRGSPDVALPEEFALSFESLTLEVPAGPSRPPAGSASPR